jgi:hypothetical protein
MIGNPLKFLLAASGMVAAMSPAVTEPEAYKLGGCLSGGTGSCRDIQHAMARRQMSGPEQGRDKQPRARGRTVRRIQRRPGIWARSWLRPYLTGLSLRQLAPFDIRSPSYFKMPSRNVLTESQSTRRDCQFLRA